jgi:hypothetical protein
MIHNAKTRKITISIPPALLLPLRQRQITERRSRSNYICGLIEADLARGARKSKRKAKARRPKGNNAVRSRSVVTESQPVVPQTSHAT